jgi:hypothetical protein
MDSIRKRFNELAEMAEAIAHSQTEHSVKKASPVQYSGSPTKYYTRNEITLDGPLLIEWRTSVLSLLSRVFGNQSTTFQEFERACESSKSKAVLTYFTQLQAIFKSAKSDFEGGYLFDVRNLVHASVFSNELDQAKHFLDANYKVPAAVVAGTVLETALRELCGQHNVPLGDRLNRINDDLAKANVYNATRKSQIKAWADIRNSAAHGKPDEFERGDVSRMIEGIRDFVAGQMS